MLDIIIPHYNEPWEVGKKFFDMLDLQRDVDFNKVHVFLINDGLENKLPDEYFENRPYHVEQITIPHAGVSVARNTGIKAGSSEWIMFCDFDDMFSCVYSLRSYMEVLPAPDFDALWSEFLVESPDENGGSRVTPRTEMNTVFVHSKMFRRQFLLDHNIEFPVGMSFDEDGEFVSTVYAIAEMKRTAKLNTPIPPYIWCWRKGSTTNSIEDRDDEGALCHYQRNKRVCEVYKKWLPENRYCGMVARTVWDAFYTLNIPELSETKAEIRRDFAQWFAEHKKYYLRADREDIPLIRRIARFERKKANFREDITISQWLEELEKETTPGGGT